MNDLRQIIDETIQAVEQMQRSGVTHVAVAPETLAELGKAPSGVVRESVPSGAGLQPAVGRALALSGVEGSSPPAGTDRGQSRTLLGMQADARATPGAAPAELAALEARARACTKCSELARCRQHVVFGVGSPRAALMFIGEAPGHDEDLQGEPFVGRAGQLLTKIIQAMGLAREEVYICNVLKCRPPENRTPLPEEVQNCLPYLLEQIELLKPQVIVGLGATAVRSLLDVQIGITKMRGHWYNFQGIPIMPTFHPAYLLRNPPAKREVWEDMQEVVRKLGRELPPESRTKATR